MLQGYFVAIYFDYLVEFPTISDYTAEKMARAFLKSNVEKHLDENTVVILDSMNYIKGNFSNFRYRYLLLFSKGSDMNCFVWLEPQERLIVW